MPIDPAEHEDAPWHELTLGAYTGLTRKRDAARLADRVERALARLGLFSRIELTWLERHWHAPREYRLWFALGADDPVAAFDRFVALRPAGWTDRDDDGFHREFCWAAEDDEQRDPFLAPEISHLDFVLFPRKDPRRRPIPD